MSISHNIKDLTSRTIILMLFVCGFFIFIVVCIFVETELFGAVFPVLSTILFFMVKNVFDQYNHERNEKLSSEH